MEFFWLLSRTQLPGVFGWVQPEGGLPKRQMLQGRARSLLATHWSPLRAVSNPGRYRRAAECAPYPLLQMRFRHYAVKLRPGPIATGHHINFSSGSRQFFRFTPRLPAR